VFLGHINKICILLKNNNLHVYHRALLKISGQWFSSLSFKDFHSPTGLFNAAFSSHNALFSGTSLPKRRKACSDLGAPSICCPFFNLFRSTNQQNVCSKFRKFKHLYSFICLAVWGIIPIFAQ